MPGFNIDEQLDKDKKQGAEREAIKQVFLELMEQRKKLDDALASFSEKTRKSEADLYKDASNEKFRKQFEIGKKIKADIKRNYEIRNSFENGSVGELGRALPGLMNTSGTPEAAEENRMILDMACCDVGKAFIAKKNIEKLFKYDPGFFMTKGFDDSIEKLEQMGTDAELPFIVVSGGLGCKKLELDPVLAEEAKYYKTMYEGGGYMYRCGFYMADGGASIHKTDTISAEDTVGIAMAASKNPELTDVYSNVSAFADICQHPLYGQIVEELEQQGILGQNVYDYKFMQETKLEDGTVVTERMNVNQAIEAMADNRLAKEKGEPLPHNFEIKIVEKTPEEKKAFAEARARIGQPVQTKNPGPVYGQGLIDDLKTLTASLDGIDSSVIKLDPNLKKLRDSINKVKLKDVNTPEKGIEVLRKIRSTTDKINSSLSKKKFPDNLAESKTAVGSFYTMVSDLANEKIGSAAVKKYAEKNNIQIDNIYSDKKINKTNKLLEGLKQKKLENAIRKDLVAKTKDFKKGKLSPEKYATTIASVMALSKIDKLRTEAKSQEDFDQYKALASKEGFAKLVKEYTTGVNKDALLDTIDSLNDRDLEMFISGKMKPDHIKEIMDDFAYNQEMHDPNRMHKMELAERDEEERAYEQYLADQEKKENRVYEIVNESLEKFGQAIEKGDEKAKIEHLSTLMEYGPIVDKIQRSKQTGSIVSIPDEKSMAEKISSNVKPLGQYLKKNGFLNGLLPDIAKGRDPYKKLSVVKLEFDGHMKANAEKEAAKLQDNPEASKQQNELQLPGGK